MLKVFLVEDETVIREGLRDRIPWEQYGYRFVGEAADGEVALPLIRKTRPDVLITDIKMPFMDGLSLSRIVREEFPKTKILIISGYDDFEYAREAISIGVDQYILKPVTRMSLRKVLQELKEKIEAEQEQEDFQSKLANLQTAIDLRDEQNTNLSSKTLKKALAYIDEHYTSENLSLGTVACEVQVGANYLSSVFSQNMQKTFTEYISEKRMEKAKKLLKSTELPTSEIAAQVGYKDPHYFSFVFKKTQGCSPREYRSSI